MSGKKNGTPYFNDALWAAIADACPCGEPGDGESAAAREGRAQVAGVSRDLHGQSKGGCFRARARRSRRFAELPSGDDVDRRGTDRVPIEPAAGAARPRDGAGDVAAASGGPGRLRPHHSPRQPERQALRPQRAGRSHRNGLRLRPQPTGGARRGIRGLGRRGSRRGTRAETCPRADYALPARHRQDDCDRGRGGRADPRGRAGASRLGGGP